VGLYLSIYGTKEPTFNSFTLIADREVQRILLELLNQMDGFDQTVNVKVRLIWRIILQDRTRFLALTSMLFAKR